MKISNTTEWIFKVVTKKEIPIYIPEKDINTFPVFEHFNYELTELYILYKFHPVKFTDLVAYKNYLINMYKRKYKAYSVEFLEPIKKLKG